MGKRISEGAKTLFFVTFFVLFSILFVQVVFNNMHFELNIYVVLVGVLAYLGIIFFLYKFLEKFRDFIKKHRLACSAAFAVIVFASIFVSLAVFAAYPSRDFERVQISAINFAVNGFIEEPYLDYLYKFPNNVPITIVLQFIYRVCNKFSFVDFQAAGIAFNVFCLLATYVLLFLICEKMFGLWQAFFSVALFMMVLPIQIYTSYFYTDMVSMPFVLAVLYLYLHFKDEQSGFRLFALSFLLCFVAAVGIQIKYSVALVCIAIVIDLLLNIKKNGKRILIFAVCFAVCFVAVSGFFDYYKFEYFLDKGIASDRETPLHAWIMMGLKGDGAHNSDDNMFIWYFPTAAEKNKYAWLELWARLKSFTPVEFILFLNQKSIRSFGVGDLGVSSFGIEYLFRHSVVSDAFLIGSPYFVLTRSIMQGFYVALFVLIISGAFFAARRKDFTPLVPYISVFGLYLFLLVWEAGERYLTNYYPVFIICAVFAVGHILNKAKPPEKSEQLSEVKANAE